MRLRTQKGTLILTTTHIIPQAVNPQPEAAQGQKALTLPYYTKPSNTFPKL